MKTLRQYVKYLASHGQRAFTSDNALEVLKISRSALNSQAHRLKKSGDLASPAKGFYVIVPPEYQTWGCLPAEDFIPLLMKHWQIPYYACLLTAAKYHGASHQAVQRFYVMLNQQKRPVLCGKIMVEFIQNKYLDQTPTQLLTVRTGYLSISTPEATIMDMLCFTKQSGGLNHIATVLTELIEVINPDKLLMLAKISQSTAWIQRLGYLLQIIEPLETENLNQCINLIRNYLNTKKIRSVLLDPNITRKNFPVDSTWKVIINTTVESDI